MCRLCIVGVSAFLFATACHDRSKIAQTEDTYTNPISVKHDNTSITFHDGRYYFLQNRDGYLRLFVMDDPSLLGETEGTIVFDGERVHGLMHMWHPFIMNREGTWYIYFTADDGNTDNHQLYVASNPSQDPLEGEFTFLGRISTDPDDNWAIHAYVFEYGGGGSGT